MMIIHDYSLVYCSYSFFWLPRLQNSISIRGLLLSHSFDRQKYGGGSELYGGGSEWLRRSVSNHARFSRVGSNPVIGTTNDKPTANSAVHPSEVGKRVLKSNSEGKAPDTH